MIDDFSMGWSHSCKPRRSCLLYLCFILRVQNNAASLIDFNMAAGGQQDCSRKSAASLKWIWRKANPCWAYTPLDNLPDYVHRGDEPVQPVCVCVCTYQIREICIRSTVAQHSLHSHERETLDTIKTMRRDCKMTPTGTKHTAATFFTSANLWRSTMVDKAIAKQKRSEHKLCSKLSQTARTFLHTKVDRRMVKRQEISSWPSSASVVLLAFLRFEQICSASNQTPSIPTRLLDRQHSEASIQYTRSFLVSIHENADRPKTA